MGINSLATINFDSELRRAGAYSTHGWRRLLFLAQRYMLGTIGLVIMVMFIAICVVSINFLIDMAYLALDPRIAYEK